MEELILNKTFEEISYFLYILLSIGFIVVLILSPYILKNRSVLESFVIIAMLNLILFFMVTGVQIAIDQVINKNLKHYQIMIFLGNPIAYNLKDRNPIGPVKCQNSIKECIDLINTTKKLP